MRILWIGTKAPVPPIDGGRLAALETLRALREAGVEVTLVAPVESGDPGEPGDPRDLVAALEEQLEPICRPRLVPASPPGWVAPLAASLAGTPFTIARHRRPEVAAEVERLLSAEPFDVVHCEQLHAFAQSEPARGRGVPVVLRAQNVESDLWRGAARLAGWSAPWLRWQAARLARHEGRVIGEADGTIALTGPDAGRLRDLAGGNAEPVAIPPPFPAELPPAEDRLAGNPPLVLLGSGGWLPNRDAVRWFVSDLWPPILDRVPGARLHLFASPSERIEGPGISSWPPPEDSREAFAPGSILVVPLRVASGIRMKILEAWARGVPVVASPEAASGLEAEDGQELLLAEDVEGWAGAVESLARDPALREALVRRGRGALRAHHDRRTVAESLIRVYRRAIRRRRGAQRGDPDDG